MGEKESAEFSFGMSVNRRCGREGMRNFLFFFRISFVASFFLMLFMEFGINPSYVFRCFLRDDPEWDSRRGSVCCAVLSELCGQTDIVK